MIQIKCNSNCFMVQNSFVDKYLCEANGSFVKVYLFVLRHFSNRQLDISNISNALNLLESDVIRAFKYWNKLGVIKFSQIGEKDFDIEFLPLEQVSSDQATDTEATTEKASPKTSMPTAVSYTKSDINTYMKNNDGIRHMFLISEQLLNRNLTDTDRRILFGFYDYLGMPIEVIFTLIEYCLSIGKTNMRYIEKVAYSWADKGVDTLAKASLFVKEENEISQTLHRFKTKFKITGREFTATEEEYIRNWVYTLKLDDKTIMDAFEKTVANTGKIAFKYMDAILRNSSNTSNPAQSSKTSNYPEKKNFFQDYNNEVSEFELELMQNRINKTAKQS